MAAFEVATGWVDITPYHNGWDPQTRPYWRAGYGCSDARLIQVSGVHNSLFAKCLVLRHDQRPCVLVTADILAFTRSMDQAIRARVRRLGIADADFTMVASHTHSGPVLDERLDPFVTYWLDGGLSEVHRYTRWLIDAVVELVRQTLQESPREPCRLEYGVGAADFSYNRYNGYSGCPPLDMSAYLDRSVPVLTARAVDGGQVRAIVFGYACHAVAGGGDAGFDGDYPGEAQNILENITYPDGVVTFFLPGACGDNDPVGNRSAALALEHGKTLAMVVQEIVDSGDNMPIDGPVRTTLSAIDLPLAVSADTRAKYERRRDTHGLNDKVGRHARRMLDPGNPSATATAIPLPIQLWTFGKDAALQLALSGGELVSGYNYHFKHRLGWGDRFWLTGYANEVPCYIPSEEQLANGGYEPGWHPDEGSDVVWSGGSMLYYGWPSRLAGSADQADGRGVEQRFIDAVHELALAHRDG